MDIDNKERIQQLLDIAESIDREIFLGLIRDYVIEAQP